jgi:hypothetical protein
LGTVYKTPLGEGSVSTVFNAQCELDEVAVWNKVLSADDVTAQFKSISASDQNLVFYYPFNEGSGEVAKNLGLAGAAYDLRFGEFFEPNTIAADAMRLKPTWTPSSAPLRLSGPDSFLVNPSGETTITLEAFGAGVQSISLAPEGGVTATVTGVAAAQGEHLAQQVKVSLAGAAGELKFTAADAAGGPRLSPGTRSEAAGAAS